MAGLCSAKPAVLCVRHLAGFSEVVTISSKRNECSQSKKKRYNPTLSAKSLQVVQNPHVLAQLNSTLSWLLSGEVVPAPSERRITSYPFEKA